MLIGNLWNRHATLPKDQPLGDRVCPPKIHGSPSQQCSISQLRRATSDSAGLELYATSNIVLRHEDGIQVLSTGTSGPLPLKIFKLVMGRASLSKGGYQVISTPVDLPHDSKIVVLYRVLDGLMSISPGQPIVQLLLLLPRPLDNPTNKKCKRHGEMGIADVFWAYKITPSHPMLTL